MSSYVYVLFVDTLPCNCCLCRVC